MFKLDNKKMAFLTILAFFFWSGISYQWYTCNIKGFCGDSPKQVKAPVEPVEPKIPHKKCEPYITEYMKFGNHNSPSEVKKLEKFLKDYEGINIKVDGVFSLSDAEAVKLFQEKYRSDVLDPWGMKRASGFVYKTTLAKINELYCNKQK